MSRNRVFGLAFLSAIALALIPSILPTGPSNSLDATGLLDKGQFFIAAGVIFLGGLLTSLTPCVYPLIPITVGVFGARQADSKGRAFVLTAAYVVGMGLVFATLGVVAALSGKAFGSSLGNQWVTVGLAVFLVVLASSMFGAFDLALPSGLAMKLNNVGGGGFIGALLMGSVAGFLAAPCTGPVLTGVLAWVSRTQDPVLGGLLLFIYALGIGVPFFLIGVFTVRLPKSGVWMEWVKSVFGIALLALAASYLRDSFPAFRTVVANVGTVIGKNPGVAISSVMAFVAVVMGAVHLSFKEGQQWLPKSMGVLLAIGAFLLRVSVQDLAPVQTHEVVNGQVAAATAFQWSLTFNPAEHTDGKRLEETLKKAAADCKPVMIDFFADWCAACKELDARTYTSKDVAAEAERFVRVKVDVTEDNDVLTELYGRFDIHGLPTVAFIDPTGTTLKDPRVTGYLAPQPFVEQMRKVALKTCGQ